LIGRAIADVFYSQAAQINREGGLAQLVLTIQGKLAQIVMPPTLVLILMAPELFAFVFGEDWRQAGEFAQWMAPWLYLVFVTSPLSTLTTVLEKQAQGLLFHAATLVTRICALVVGTIYDDLMLAVILFSLGSAFWRAAYLVWITHISGNQIAELFKLTTNTFLKSSVIVGPLAIARFWDAPQYLIVAALVLSSVLMILHYLRMAKEAW
jgi:O-antigen/teichoic acid export membrane protein